MKANMISALVASAFLATAAGAATRFEHAALPKLAKPLLAGAADLTMRLRGDPSALQAALADTSNSKKLFGTAS